MYILIICLQLEIQRQRQACSLEFGQLEIRQCLHSNFHILVKDSRELILCTMMKENVSESIKKNS